MALLPNTMNWQIAPGGTLVDLENGQAMHSSMGAWEEAHAVYVAQSQIGLLAARLEGQRVVLYDIGMGVAANALAFLEAWLKLPDPAPPIQIVSFESHPEALVYALKNLSSFPFLEPWVDTLEELLRFGRCAREGWTWELRRGDFQNAALGPSPNLIYFDFYAPKTCEELWSAAIFRKLREACARSECRLITYSAATRVRSAMLEAGWFVGPGAATSLKSETTLASTHPDSIPLLDQAWLERRPELHARLQSHPQFSR